MDNYRAHRRVVGRPLCMAIALADFRPSLWLAILEDVGLSGSFYRRVTWARLTTCNGLACLPWGFQDGG